MESDDLPGRGVHRNPHPVAVRLLPHKAPELVQLGLQPLHHHRQGTALWLGIEGLGGRLEPPHPKLQKPPPTDAYGATDPTQRDSLQQKPFNQSVLFLGDHSIVWLQDERPSHRVYSDGFASPYGCGRFFCTTLIHIEDTLLAAP